jgi:hypothetical protein
VARARASAQCKARLPATTQHPTALPSRCPRYQARTRTGRMRIATE